jgi:hypothetical protein
LFDRANGIAENENFVEEDPHPETGQEDTEG